MAVANVSVENPKRENPSVNRAENHVKDLKQEEEDKLFIL